MRTTPICKEIQVYLKGVRALTRASEYVCVQVYAHLCTHARVLKTGDGGGGWPGRGFGDEGREGTGVAKQRMAVC